MDLSVAVVNWNSGAYLDRLLDSLAPLSHELSRVIVVDNASSDGSVANQRADVFYRLLDRNHGFAGAANLAIEQSCSEFVLLLNPDIQVLPETVRRLYQRMEGQPKTAIVCPLLAGEGGMAQHDFQFRPLPGFWSAFVDALFLDEVPKRLRGWLATRGDFVISVRVERRATGPRDEDGVGVEQPAAAFWLLRKAAWKEIGGFDESFAPAWFEDVDFCKRLGTRGWNIRCFPDVQAIHRGGLALETLPYSSFIRTYYGNMLRYFRKHHPARYMLLWLPVKAGVWARLALKLR